jgi:hypothetical protein
MIQRQQLQQQRLSRITIITTITTTTTTITIIIAKQSVIMKLPRLAPGFFFSCTIHVLSKFFPTDWAFVDWATVAEISLSKEV